MISIQQKLFGTKIFDRRIYLFATAVLLLFVFDAVAVYFSWYWTHQWLDIPVHAIAGLLVSIMLYYLVFANRTTALFLGIQRTKEDVFSVMVFWVLVVAISWEIVEFVFGRTYLSPNFGLDLFLDITVTCLGAVVGYIIIKLWKLQTKNT